MYSGEFLQIDRGVVISYVSNEFSLDQLLIVFIPICTVFKLKLFYSYLLTLFIEKTLLQYSYKLENMYTSRYSKFKQMTKRTGFNCLYLFVAHSRRKNLLKLIFFILEYLLFKVKSTFLCLY